jgi:hypothetical protein
MKQKMSDKKKLLIIAAATVLLCGGAGGGIYWAQGLIEEEQLVIGGIEEQISAAEAKIKKIPGVERDVIILRENLQEYVKILPEEKDVTSFGRATNQFISQSAVTLDRWQPIEMSVGAKGSAFGRYSYELQFKGTLWQFMKLLSFFENYERFVKVTQFTLQTGDGQRGATTEEGDVLHQISLTVETYVYNPDRRNKDVSIPNYQNKVANLRADILQARNNVVAGGYEFRGPRGRRDIFVDPRETSADVSKGTLPEDMQRNLVEECKRDLNEILGMHRKIKDPATTIIQRYKLERARTEKLAQLQAKIEDIQSKAKVTNLVLRVRWTKEVLDPLLQLRRDISNDVAGKSDQFLSEKELRELIMAMKDDLLNGDLEAAKVRYEEVQERTRVPRDDPRYDLAFEVVKLYERTRVAIEFSGLKIQIGGVVVNDDGKSGLILNGSVFQEGDYVDPNLLIKSVAAEHVEFVFKGFTVMKTW